MDFDFASFDLTWLANQPLVRWPLTIAYMISLLAVALYGAHRYFLVWLYYRNIRRRPRPQAWFAQLPRLTVQLPMYNEAHVAKRIIDAACNLDYPRDLLQIQVIDDSTDHSARIARNAADYWASQGVDIQYVHRANRSGFKAGALAAAMPKVTGDFIAIFDADFVPTPDFLRRTIHYFTDPAVGMVQTRWDHLNRDDSILTRSQAIFLDGHFIIEHTARNRADCWINFNGTAGLWRKSAIESAGGWHADTLTEDVDLSYRAQMKGWRFVFIPWVRCPAELPPEINAFKSQQHRWTKGSIQTALKLLPKVFMSKAPLRVKREAFFHLTNPLVYVFVTLMVLLFYPAFFINMQLFENGTMAALFWGMLLFALGTASAGVFYIASQKAQKRGTLTTILQLPILMSIGIGIAVNNARGCIEALLGMESPFVRTPKYNTVHPGQSSAPDDDQQTTAPAPDNSPTTSVNGSDGRAPTARRRRAWIRAKYCMPVIEIALGFYMLECANLAIDPNRNNTLVSLPFLLLFAAGYFYVGLSSLWQLGQSWWASRTPEPQLTS